ncbi:MAG: DNA-processing protein DprA [Oscillospiraceae bacterium]
MGVLGNGLDVIYPAPTGTCTGMWPAGGVCCRSFRRASPPNGRNFPRRDRIIQRPCLRRGGVVEAPAKSGALITGAAGPGPGAGRVCRPGQRGCRMQCRQ